MRKENRLGEVVEGNFDFPLAIPGKFFTERFVYIDEESGAF